MSQFHNFRFLNDRLNHTLIVKLLTKQQTGLQVFWDKDGLVYFDANDEEVIEDVLAAVRATEFHSWQVLSCPSDWVDKYRTEMKRRNIPFVEELNDGRVEFLLPSDQEPHDWEFASA